jgi:hypothetical protein
LLDNYWFCTGCCCCTKCFFQNSVLNRVLKLHKACLQDFCTSLPSRDHSPDVWILSILISTWMTKRNFLVNPLHPLFPSGPSPQCFFLKFFWILKKGDFFLNKTHFIYTGKNNFFCDKISWHSKKNYAKKIIEPPYQVKILHSGCLVHSYYCSPADGISVNRSPNLIFPSKII